MAWKIGKVILGDTFKQTAFILEEGTYKTVHQFDPQTVIGNLDLDPQARQYPARLTGQIVKFSLDENNQVTMVATLTFQEFIHEACARGAITMAAKDCACGNTTNSVYKHCEVCAIINNLCVLCGKKIY